jgi:hypothetical protein
MTDVAPDLRALVDRASQLVPFGGVRSIEVLDAVDGFAKIEYVGDRSIFNVQEAAAFVAHAVLEELTGHGWVVSVGLGHASATMGEALVNVRLDSGTVPLLELLAAARERGVPA